MTGPIVVIAAVEGIKKTKTLNQWVKKYNIDIYPSPLKIRSENFASSVILNTARCGSIFSNGLFDGSNASRDQELLNAGLRLGSHIYFLRTSLNLDSSTSKFGAGFDLNLLSKYDGLVGSGVHIDLHTPLFITYPMVLPRDEIVVIIGGNVVGCNRSSAKEKVKQNPRNIKKLI